MLVGTSKHSKRHGLLRVTRTQGRLDYRVMLVLAMTSIGHAARAQSIQNASRMASEYHLAQDAFGQASGWANPVLRMPDPRLIPSSRARSTVPGSRVLANDVQADRAMTMSMPGSRSTHVLIGAVVGAIAGTGYVMATNRRCEAQASDGPPCGIVYVPALIVLGVGGGVVGGLIGSLLPTSP